MVVRDGAEKLAEVVLKRRWHEIEEKGERARKIRAARIELKRSAKVRGPVGAEVIVERAKRRRLEESRFQRKTRQFHCGIVPYDKEAKVVVAVRNINTGVGPSSRKLLKELGLVRPYDVVFVPNTREDLKNLRVLENLIFFGYPSPEIVRGLITRRGRFKTPAEDADGGPSEGKSVKVKQDVKPHAPASKRNRQNKDSQGEDSQDEDSQDEHRQDERRQKGERASDGDGEGAEEEPGHSKEEVKDEKLSDSEQKLSRHQHQPKTPADPGIPISDNLCVEERFADEGLLSVEDLVQEIYYVGPHFRRILAELLPIKVDSVRKADGVAAKIRTGFQKDMDGILRKVL